MWENGDHIIISYQTLSKYHTSKQRHKNTTWYWGHDQEAKKAWDNHALTKVSTNIQRLAKIHFTHIQTKIHKNTQDMPQNEINCIQIIKLISADFGNHKIWKNYFTCWVCKSTCIILWSLTAHNWQKWKRVFLICPCHKIYRDEAVGLKCCKYTWKLTIFVKIWNLGNILKIWYFVNNCLI